MLKVPLKRGYKKSPPHLSCGGPRVKPIYERPDGDVHAPDKCGIFANVEDNCRIITGRNDFLPLVDWKGPRTVNRRKKDIVNKHGMAHRNINCDWNGDYDNYGNYGNFQYFEVP